MVAQWAVVLCVIAVLAQWTVMLCVPFVLLQSVGTVDCHAVCHVCVIAGCICWWWCGGLSCCVSCLCHCRMLVQWTVMLCVIAGCWHIVSLDCHAVCHCRVCLLVVVTQWTVMLCVMFVSAHNVEAAIVDNVHQISEKVVRRFTSFGYLRECADK